MYVRIATFRLNDLSCDQYAQQADQLATGFARWPGLISKVWLADPRTTTFGGVYVFESKRHADASRRTDAFASMASNRHFAALSVTEYEVLGAPTAHTGGPLVGGGGKRAEPNRRRGVVIPAFI